MPHQVTTERSSSRSRRMKPAVDHAPHPAGGDRTFQEIRAALASIPADSVTARTAGALRVAESHRTIVEERAAFERAVAKENAQRMES